MLLADGTYINERKVALEARYRTGFYIVRYTGLEVGNRTGFVGAILMEQAVMFTGISDNVRLSRESVLAVRDWPDKAYQTCIDYCHKHRLAFIGNPEL